MNRASFTPRTGFTIVELLIVIVVIAILATVSIIAYRGIQERAKAAVMDSGLSQAAKKVKADYVTDETYPSTINPNGSVSFTIISSLVNRTFCITGVGEGFNTRSIDQNGSYIDGPCDGLSGGSSYCPTNSYMAINGYYCDGVVGSTPTNQTGISIRKLLASDAEVPVGAPGYYVGRQADRDVYSTPTVPAVAGEVFCVTGWAVTVSSAVDHRIGVAFTVPGSAEGIIWNGTAISAASATGTWRKANGCFTAPANTTAVRLWTQNNGPAYGTSTTPWYQTAIVLKKQ